MLSLDAMGVALILQHLFTIAATLVLLAVVIASGVAGLRRLAVAPEGAAETLTLSAALGIGVVATALLIVSAVVGPHWYTLWGTLAALGFITRRNLAGLPELTRATFREVVGVSTRGRTKIVVIAALAVIVLALLLLAIQPPTDYDSLAYHLQVPRLWLAQARMFLPADNYHTAYVGVSEFLYLPLLSVGAATASQVLNVLILLLLPVGVFATARAVAGDQVARLAFWLVLGSPILLQTGVTPMVDVTLAFVLVAANLAALKATMGIGESRQLILAGALLGAAAGVKYLGLLYALALTPVLMVGLIKIARRSRAEAVRALGVAFAAWTFAVAPWAAKNMALLGNPVYPVLSGPRAEPWLRPLYPDVSPVGVDSGAFTALTRIREPLSLRRLILAPASITSNANSEDSTPFWILFLGPLALLSPWRWKAAAVVAPPLMYAALLLAYSHFSNLRYFIPVIPGLTIGAAMMVWMVRERLSQSSRPILYASVIAMALPSVMAYRHMFEQRTPVAYAVGRESPRTFLHRYWETAALMPAVEWINAKTEPDARVILLFDARGFYFDREVREDINIRNWVFLAPRAHAPGCLGGLGASYVILNQASQSYFSRRGADMGALQWPAFDRFRQECLILQYDHRGMRIYSLHQRSVHGSRREGSQVIGMLARP
jgi:hypothetical protein